MAEAIRVFNPDQKFQDMQNDINRTFDKLIRYLNARRNLLLWRIEQMREDYRINTDLGNAMKELSIWKDGLKSNLLRSLGEDFDEQLRKFENSKVVTVNLQFVAFRCYSDKIREAIDDIDLFELFPEYVGRENPVLTACYRGSGNGEFYNPRGIALDRARAEVYVCDKGNSRIQVLSTVGVYIRQFGGDRLMDPHAICLSQQDELYVTDRVTQCVMKFSRTGEFLAKAGSRGNAPEQFSGITGLCCEAGLVYVCDGSLQEVLILDSSLNFIKYFGYGELIAPSDITILSGTIYILSVNDNCIYCYNLDCTLRKKIELIGQEQLMTTAYFFTIDKKGNFLITDADLERINIFSPKGVLIHILGAGQLPFLYGIALDKFDWIICVCGSKECFIKF